MNAEVITNLARALKLIYESQGRVDQSAEHELLDRLIDASHATVRAIIAAAESPIR